MKSVNLNQEIRPIFSLLKLTFGIVPIIAGLDKFTNLLTSWEKYIHPGIAGILPFAPHTFMIIVGFIEIVAGITVLRKAVIGGFIVSACLTLIAIKLLISGQFLDVAVRDLVMAVGSFSLAGISIFID
jgi:uncharacterized membrane protein YphA (DoxX/SURF4 family)